MERWELPAGWKWQQLEGVVVAETGRRNPGDSPDSPFVYIEISSVDSTTGTIVEPRELLGREAPSRARKIVRTGDVIFATTRPYLRNIAVVLEEYDDQICSTGFCVLRPDRDLAESLWLYYLCRSDVVLSQVLPLMRGASYPAVTDSDVLSAEIPCPPLPVQRRIIARIETLLAEVSEARQIHQRIVEDTGRLMEAVAAETFPGLEDELPSGWMVKTVKDISEKPQYGYTQSAKTEPVGPKFLRITDIQNGQVNWDTVPYCECDDDTLGKYRLEPGDLLFARSGATTGKTFLVIDPPIAVFASYLIRLQVRQSAIPEYVYWFFQSPYYWAQIKPRGAAQPNVNATTLSRLELPIPEDERVQRRIVAYLNEMQSKVRAMQAIQEQDGQMLERLEHAILARAFRGEL